MEKNWCIFESGHMIDSVGSWYRVIIVCTGSIHSGAIF